MPSPHRRDAAPSRAATVATWHRPGGHTIVRDIVAGVEHVRPGAAGGGAGTDSGPNDSTGFLRNRLRQVRAGRVDR